MKRLLGVVFSALLLMTASAVVQAGDEMGYELITPPQNTSTGDKVEVLEFFWYGCPHCYALEPTMNKWLAEDMPDYVEFIRVAAPLNSSWSDHARAFYAAEVLGVIDDFHEPMFKAYHAEKRRIFKPDHLADFAAEQGIDRDKFMGAMKSFAVETKLSRANQLARSMGLTGVPTIVINGKYKTSASIAGGYPQMMKVISQLVAEENAAK